jgi:uncharacterized protein YoxC
MFTFALTQHGTTLAVAGIAATASIITCLITGWTVLKVREVHDLTNSRLARIEGQLEGMTAERNRLQRKVDQASEP